MPNQHENSDILRVRRGSKAKLAAVARHEDRTMVTQFDLILDAGMAALGLSYDEATGAVTRGEPARAGAGA